MRRNVIRYVMREGLSFRRKKAPLALSPRKPAGIEAGFLIISNAPGRVNNSTRGPFFQEKERPSRALPKKAGALPKKAGWDETGLFKNQQCAPEDARNEDRYLHPLDTARRFPPPPPGADLSAPSREWPAAAIKRRRTRAAFSSAWSQSPRSVL